MHRQYHTPNQVQLSNLLPIKTGGCPEDCGYCSQSAFAKAGVKALKLVDRDAVVVAATEAKVAGSSRFCMGAAWREPRDREMDALCSMVSGVKALGLETCMALGMLSANRPAASPPRASIITTTISTARPNITNGSLPPAPIRSAWRHWTGLALLACRYAGA